MNPSSSYSKASTSSPLMPPHSPLGCFTPIRESEEWEGSEQSPKKHCRTPIHRNTSPCFPAGDRRHHAVSFTDCRPNTSENRGGVGLQSLFMASPSNMFRSLAASLTLTRKSPKPLSTAAREEHWKIAIADISLRLVQANRKRDEAVLEASRLKRSMAGLEQKLNKLETNCNDLKSTLDLYDNNTATTSPSHGLRDPGPNGAAIRDANRERVIDEFLISVSESRAAVRELSRVLALQLRRIEGGGNRIAKLLLETYDAKTKSTRSLIPFLEAILNRVLFEDFESAGFERGSVTRVLDPLERCGFNYGSYGGLKLLTWEAILREGTRHFSQEFSGFCDRKLGQIAHALGWFRAWPEHLLRAFFGASKAVWLVHLLAGSVHPCIPIFRVDTGGGFNPVYMEEVGAEDYGGCGLVVPTAVRAMVAPGFYVFREVVKCKVLCKYGRCGHE